MNDYAIISALIAATVSLLGLSINWIVAGRRLKVDHDNLVNEKESVANEKRQTEIQDRDGIVDAMRQLIQSQTEKIDQLQKELQATRSELEALRKQLAHYISIPFPFVGKDSDGSVS